MVCALMQVIIQAIHTDLFASRVFLSYSAVRTFISKFKRAFIPRQ